MNSQKIQVIDMRLVLIRTTFKLQQFFFFAFFLERQPLIVRTKRHYRFGHAT